MTVTGGDCKGGGQHSSDGAGKGSINGLTMYVCDKCHQLFGVRA